MLPADELAVRIGVATLEPRVIPPAAAIALDVMAVIGELSVNEPAVEVAVNTGLVTAPEMAMFPEALSVAELVADNAELTVMLPAVEVAVKIGVVIPLGVVMLPAEVKATWPVAVKGATGRTIEPVLVVTVRFARVLWPPRLLRVMLPGAMSVREPGVVVAPSAFVTPAT
jgi:hypothetical protein